MSFIEKVDGNINKLKDEILHLEKIKKLIISFPDLHEVSDRWNKKYLVSSKANTIVENVDFKHSCGCCPDAALFAYFYLTVDGVRIYADPYYIHIGNLNECGFGDIPNSNWKSSLIENNIPEKLNEKVESYFLENPPVNYEDED